MYIWKRHRQCVKRAWGACALPRFLHFCSSMHFWARGWSQTGAITQQQLEWWWQPRVVLPPPQTYMSSFGRGKGSASKPLPAIWLCIMSFVMCNYESIYVFLSVMPFIYIIFEENNLVMCMKDACWYITYITNIYLILDLKFSLVR